MNIFPGEFLQLNNPNTLQFQQEEIKLKEKGIPDNKRTTRRKMSYMYKKNNLLKFGSILIPEPFLKEFPVHHIPALRQLWQTPPLDLGSPLYPHQFL